MYYVVSQQQTVLDRAGSFLSKCLSHNLLCRDIAEITEKFLRGIIPTISLCRYAAEMKEIFLCGNIPLVSPC